MGSLKRHGEEYGGEVIDHIKMANYLTFLSQGLDVCGFTPSMASTSDQFSAINQVFECKTCSRQFPSFQALGGHRASHKRLRRLMTINGQTNSLSISHNPEGASTSPSKPKAHECSICGLRFGIGQALGGHMRRHRVSATRPTTTMDNTVNTKEFPLQTALVKTTSSKISKCLDMDLNLTPLENANLEFRLGGKMPMATMVD